MQKQLPRATGRIGSRGPLLTSWDSDGITRHQRRRGYIGIMRSWGDLCGTIYNDGGHFHPYRRRPYATVSAAALRDALDRVTIDGETVTVPVFHCVFGNSLTIRPGKIGSRVFVLAPCGETRSYLIANLDRALSRFGV